MAIQNFGSAPGRNNFKASGVKQGEVSVGAAHKSTVTADAHQTAAPAKGGAIKGFSGSGVKSPFLGGMVPTGKAKK